MNSIPSNASGASPVHRFTPGAILSGLSFSLIVIVAAIVSLRNTRSVYDFRSFYAAGFLLRHNPSQLFSLPVQDAIQNAVVSSAPRGVPFYHPAYEALLYVPFTLLPYVPAYFAFIAFNLVILALCYRLAPAVADPILSKVPRPAFFLIGFPVLLSIVQGQDNIIFFLLLCLVWRCLDSGRDRSAGLLLALALFKLQLVPSLLLFLIVFLPARRAIRLLLGFLPAAVGVASLCLLITGIRGTTQWFHLLGEAAVASHMGAPAQARVFIFPEAMPSLNGFLYLCGTRFLSAHTALAIDTIGSLCLFVVALIIVLRTHTLEVAFSAAVAASLLLSPHLFLQDYVLFTLPVLLLRTRIQPLLAAAFYLIPLGLFLTLLLRWEAVMAIVPMALLITLLRDSVSPQTTTLLEKATTHPLTALD